MPPAYHDVYARWREAPEEEREAITAQLAEAFATFEADGGYELPGVALCAVAR